MFDAAPAYRGYRLQALYTLHRMLDPTAEGMVVQPEGSEDLTVFDAEGHLVEVAQVKAYTSSLTLSDLSPEKSSSFLHRAAALLQSRPALRVALISFGAVGPELSGALTGEMVSRREVERKLVELHGFAAGDAVALLLALQLEPVREEALKGEIIAKLSAAVTGVDPDRAFDLLTFWLYGCAERRCRLTQRDLIRQIAGVGRFLAARVAHHAEWFTSIVPFEDRSVDSDKEFLASGFYRGVAATYEHVLAGLDVPRPTKLLELAGKFEHRRIVIVHGASGQGKTTLAYRYLHEAYPDLWRFEVRRVQDAASALRIAAALASHADTLDVSIAVFVDVTPSDDEWPELVKQLAMHQRIRVLVAIREEDWRRAGIADYEMEFADVELGFDRAEAEELDRSLAARQLPDAFVDFEDAWGAFGSDGPLLEFVHLVTQGESLRQRLRQQIHRLEDEAERDGRAAAALRLLRLVAVASAYGGRLRLAPLAERLALQAPRRTVELLEQEYLIQVSEAGTLLDGLHPIRSAILADLLSDRDGTSWGSSAAACLHVMNESDIGSFLLSTFSRRRTGVEQVLDALQVYEPSRWTGISGVVRALLWLGLQEYATSNKDVLDDARKDAGTGWMAVLDTDVAGVSPGLATSISEMIGRFRGENRRQQIEALQARQNDKGRVVTRAVAWMQGRTTRPVAPQSTAEWAAAADAILWAGWLGVSWPIFDWLPGDVLSESIQTLPLNAAADLIVGLQHGGGNGFEAWLLHNQPVLLNRFREETVTPVVEDDGQKLTAHFIVAPGLSEEPPAAGELPALDPKNRLHNEALVRIDLLRRLVPNRELYACQGYGHRGWDIAQRSDATRKTGIPRDKLPLRSLVNINSTFRGLVEYPWRPATWQEYARQVMGMREDAVRCLNDLVKALPTYLAAQRPTKLLGNSIPSEAWYQRWRAFREPPLLPKSAADKWGFVDELLIVASAQEQQNRSPKLLTRSLALERYQPLLQSTAEYARALENFLLQAPAVMTTNAQLRKQSTGQKAETISVTPDRAVGHEAGANAGRLSVLNLSDAWKAVAALQTEYRFLLGHVLGGQRLDSLEQRETYLFASAWPLWHAYALQPGKVLQDPVRQAAERVEVVLGQVNKGLRRNLRSLFENDQTRVTVVAGMPLWESTPALWLTMDVADAVATLRSLETTLNAVRQAMSALDASDLGDEVLDLQWRNVVVVPLVRGRSLTGTAWRLSTRTLKEARDLSALDRWAFVPQTIPPSGLDQLGIPVWDDPRLEVGIRLSAAANELWALAAHVHDLASLPSLDQVGTEIVQQHLERIGSQLSGHLQVLLDARSEMVGTFDALPPGDRETRQHLVLAVEALNALRAVVVPTKEFAGSAAMELGAFGNWADQLREDGIRYASLAYFAWATDVIDSPGAQNGSSVLARIRAMPVGP